MSAPGDLPGQAAGGGRLQATEVVERQLLLLFRKVRAGFEQLAREVHPGLDAAAYGILQLIDTGAATTVTTLAERLSVGKPTISRQVTALEKLGLLTRQPAHARSRAVQLRLTDEGRVRLEGARSRRQERFRVMLEGWPLQDVRTLGELLDRFNQSVW